MELFSFIGVVFGLSFFTLAYYVGRLKILKTTLTQRQALTVLGLSLITWTLTILFGLLLLFVALMMSGAPGNNDNNFYVFLGFIFFACTVIIPAYTLSHIGSYYRKRAYQELLNITLVPLIAILPALLIVLYSSLA